MERFGTFYYEFPGSKLHKIRVIILKTHLHFVQYPMSTTYIKNLTALYYVFPMNYLKF